MTNMEKTTIAAHKGSLTANDELPNALVVCIVASDTGHIAYSSNCENQEMTVELLEEMVRMIKLKVPIFSGRTEK